MRDDGERKSRRHFGLGGSAVFFPQFVLGSAKKLKFKTWKSFEPNPQNSFVWCHVRGNVWDVWGKKGQGNVGLGGSAVFLHSLCAWVSKGI